MPNMELENSLDEGSQRKWADGESTTSLIVIFVDMVARNHLRRFGQFLQDFHGRLKSQEANFDIGFVGASDKRLIDLQVRAHKVFFLLTLCERHFQLSPQEYADCASLVHCENMTFVKVVRILSTVCAEVDLLKHEARTNLFPALLFYGEYSKHSFAP